jgi:hypothetical protein
MFGSEYFKTHIHQQRLSVGSTPSVKVYLHGGNQYIVHSIAGVEEGYVMLDTYPDEKHEGREQIAIAYESISEVVITLAKQEEMNRIGFNA